MQGSLVRKRHYRDNNSYLCSKKMRPRRIGQTIGTHHQVRMPLNVHAAYCVGRAHLLAGRKDRTTADAWKPPSPIPSAKGGVTALMRSGRLFGKNLMSGTSS